LKKDLLATGLWTPFGEPLVVTPDETVVLYVRRLPPRRQALPREVRRGTAG
jgi:hypothetical protein